MTSCQSDAIPTMMMTTRPVSKSKEAARVASESLAIITRHRHRKVETTIRTRRTERRA